MPWCGITSVANFTYPGLADPSAGLGLTARGGGVACSLDKGLLAPGIISVYLNLLPQ